MEGGLELGLFQLERIRQLAFFKILWLGGARDDPENEMESHKGKKRHLPAANQVCVKMNKDLLINGICKNLMKKLVSRDPILSSFFGSDHSNSESDPIFN